MNTTDFSGTYDYEREEAKAEAEQFNEVLVPECNAAELSAHVLRIAKHWRRVLCAQGMADFVDEWNRQCPDYRMEN